MSLKPEMRARLGTEAEIETLPLEVGPTVPCEAAIAGALCIRPDTTTLASASAISLLLLTLTVLIQNIRSVADEGKYLGKVNISFAKISALTCSSGHDRSTTCLFLAGALPD